MFPLLYTLGNPYVRRYQVASVLRYQVAFVPYAWESLRRSQADDVLYAWESLRDYQVAYVLYAWESLRI